MDGIGDAAEVPGVLDQHVLEATSGGDERDASLAGGADDVVRR